jgi:YD repeat-containing protein
MKIIISLILIFLFGIISVVAQQSEIRFTYDASGNRTSRDYVQGGQKSRPISLAEVDILVSATDKRNHLNDVRLYPNPTTGQITVRFLGKFSYTGGLIQILDLSGMLLRQVNNLKSENLFDLASYPAGTYLVRYVSPGATKQWKVVKE